MKKALSIILIAFIASRMLLGASDAKAADAAISPEDVVSTAESLLGKYPKYVSGGRSPSDGGFDCTGLVYYVFHTCLGSDVTYSQIWNRSAGTKIENRSDFQKGDIVFGLNNKGSWHTGIYIGNDTMIHSGSSKGVSKTTMNGWFTVQFARRLTTSNGSATAGTASKPNVFVDGQNAAVSWEYSGTVSKFDVYLVQHPWRWEDIKYHVSTTSTWCTFEGVAPGEYRAFVIARPNADTKQSEWADVTVSAPGADNLSPEAATISNGVYTLAPWCAPNHRLDVAGGSAENEANIQIYQDNGTMAQQFEFTSTGDGYYLITAKVSGKCLDVQEGNTASGTNVWQYTSNSTDAQKWKLEAAEDGGYYVVPKLNPQLCLDVYAAKNDNGTNVQVYTRNQSSAQKWKLTPVCEPKTSGEGEWGAWSDWSSTYVASSDTRQVETRQVKISDAHTEYRYGRYVDSTGSHDCWCASYLESRSHTNSSAVLQYSDWSATQYYANRNGWTCGYCRGDHMGVHHIGADGRAWWAEFELPDGSYYWEETRSADAVYETQYRYRDA